MDAISVGEEGGITLLLAVETSLACRAGTVAAGVKEVEVDVGRAVFVATATWGLKMVERMRSERLKYRAQSSGLIKKRALVRVTLF